MRRAWLLALLLGGCGTPLVEGVSEREANDAVAVLHAWGVTADKAGAGDRFSVRVEAADLGRAWQALRRAGLPREPAPQPVRRLVAGPAESARADRARQADAVAALLRARPDVLDARVVLDAAGGAAVVRAAAGQAPAAVELERLIRAAGGLAAEATLALEIHPWPAPPPGAPPARPSRGPLYAVSGAALLLGLLCLLLVTRLRRLRRAP